MGSRQRNQSGSLPKVVPEEELKSMVGTISHEKLDRSPRSNVATPEWRASLASA
jgi:hypothetical protein